MEKLTFAQQTCVRHAGMAMHRLGALWPHCRVGVAVSGGSDSFVLLKVMRLRQRILPFPIEIMALHVNPGFCGGTSDALLPWLAVEGIAGHVEICDHGQRAHSQENRKRSACFRCAWLRRKRLFELCSKYSLTHLALGHNADDLVETFFMNLCRNGRVQGMSMTLPLFRGRLLLIRPLLLLEKKLIGKAAAQWDLPVWDNRCPSAGKTERSSMKVDLDILFSRSRGARRNMFNAIARWQMAQDVDKGRPV